jgi:hypothetical protein
LFEGTGAWNIQASWVVEEDDSLVGDEDEAVEETKEEEPAADNTDAIMSDPTAHLKRKASEDYTYYAVPRTPFGPGMVFSDVELLYAHLERLQDIGLSRDLSLSFESLEDAKHHANIYVDPSDWEKMKMPFIDKHL